MPGGIEDNLSRIRAAIDGVDDEMVLLLAKRRSLVLRLAEIKKNIDMPIHDPRRERRLVSRAKALGASRGLQKRFVETIFQLIIANSKKIQRRWIRP